jgi:hypothetical protein
VREAQDRADSRRDGVTDDDFFLLFFFVSMIVIIDGIERRLATSKGIGQVDEKREARRPLVFFIISVVTVEERVRVDDEFVGLFVEHTARPSAVEMSAIDALIVVFEYSKPRVYADRKPIMVDRIIVVVLVVVVFERIFFVGVEMVANSLPNIFYDSIIHAYFAILHRLLVVLVVFYESTRQSASNE